MEKINDKYKALYSIFYEDTCKTILPLVDGKNIAYHQRDLGNRLNDLLFQEREGHKSKFYEKTITTKTGEYGSNTDKSFSSHDDFDKTISLISNKLFKYRRWGDSYFAQVSTTFSLSYTDHRPRIGSTIGGEMLHLLDFNGGQFLDGALHVFLCPARSCALASVAEF